MEDSLISSHYFDSETGLYYLKSRYYDPQVGRFINADGYVSTGQGVTGNNMFAYCGNNPVNFEDPNGEFFDRLWDNFVKKINKAKSVFAVAGGITQLDSPVPGLADLAGAAVAGIAAACCLGSAAWETITSPAPSVSIPKVETNEKEVTLPAPPSGGTTYYHVTTPANAASIMMTGTMVGSNWEGKYVCAWRRKPNKYAMEYSGARFGTIISFKTNVPFVDDLGILDQKVKKYYPVTSVRPGPITVWDVKIVG